MGRGAVPSRRDPRLAWDRPRHDTEGKHSAVAEHFRPRALLAVFCAADSRPSAFLAFPVPAVGVAVAGSTPGLRLVQGYSGSAGGICQNNVLALPIGEDSGRAEQLCPVLAWLGH